jgi:hypothetical protein
MSKIINKIEYNWNDYLSYHKGKGFSLKDLSNYYHKRKYIIHSGWITFNQGGSTNYNEVYNNLILQLSNMRFPDILYISIQESSDNHIKDILNQTKLYKIIYRDILNQGHLGKQQLIILVKNTFPLLNRIIINNKSSGSLRCGYQWSSISKGGLIVTLQIANTKLQVIGCHLPSKVNKPDERDSCFIKILNKYPMESDITRVILGDLNYRTSNMIELNAEERDKIKSMRCEKPTKKVKDQLIESMKTSLKEYKLVESSIKFCQTCRLKEINKSNKNIYRNTVIPYYDSKRIPSWCDRILYYNPLNNLLIDDYNNFNLSNHSDHLAVYLNGFFIVDF